jgi:methionine sulfoxide reductase catalytic subunit
MNVIHRRGWEIPDRLATPEHFVFNRRSFVAAGVSALTLSPLGATAQRLSDVAKLPDPSADLYPAKRNENLLDRAITNEKVNGNYNNFYEFGTDRCGARQASKAYSAYRSGSPASALASLVRQSARCSTNA